MRVRLSGLCKESSARGQVLCGAFGLRIFLQGFDSKVLLRFLQGSMVPASITYDSFGQVAVASECHSLWFNLSDGVTNLDSTSNTAESCCDGSVRERFKRLACSSLHDV